MSEAIEICTKPRIVVTDVDYERLTNLAAAVRERSPDAAVELQIEMARASIADPGSISSDVVRMGSNPTMVAIMRRRALASGSRLRIRITPCERSSQPSPSSSRWRR